MKVYTLKDFRAVYEKVVSIIEQCDGRYNPWSKIVEYTWCAPFAPWFDALERFYAIKYNGTSEPNEDEMWEAWEEVEMYERRIIDALGL